RHLVRSALVALAVLGVQLDPAELGDPATLRALGRHLAAAGVAARWLAQYQPMPTPEARPGTCAARPWAHVRDAERTTAREAHARYLAERVARVTAADLRLSVPSTPDAGLRGCLLCGIAAVIVPAAQVVAMGGADLARSAAWRKTIAATPSVLGAPASPEPIRGWLCPHCADAVDHTGAVGPAAMERALREHLRTAGREDELRRIEHGPDDELIGLTSWAGRVLRARRSGRLVRPNAAPWDHVRVNGAAPARRG
ncbi:hypothetical protein, partial [Micropruina sp.]|uniref:hypothetical protein n=1 Tax=Micropruina sp. TaxID=2737536 RepID=UPI0039E2E3C7